MGANFSWHGLTDLMGKWRLSAECYCGHAGAIDPHKLARYYAAHGWSTGRFQLAEHLFCTGCRRKGRGGRVYVGITINDPTNDDFFPRNEESWKFLVRRLRNR